MPTAQITGCTMSQSSTTITGQLTAQITFSEIEVRLGVPYEVRVFATPNRAQTGGVLMDANIVLGKPNVFLYEVVTEGEAAVAITVSPTKQPATSTIPFTLDCDRLFKTVGPLSSAAAKAAMLKSTSATLDVRMHLSAVLGATSAGVQNQSVQ